jgi:hypothetical protein
MILVAAVCIPSHAEDTPNKAVIRGKAEICIMSIQTASKRQLLLRLCFPIYKNAFLETYLRSIFILKHMH